MTPMFSTLLLLFLSESLAQDCVQEECCGSDGVTYPTPCDAPPGVSCVDSNRCAMMVINPGCCNRLQVRGNLFPNGTYVKNGIHNGRPVYRSQSGGRQMCIFFGRHWKIEACDWLQQGDGSQGFGWTEEQPNCPSEVGPQWHYYSWQGASNSLPVDRDIQVRCEGCPVNEPALGRSCSISSSVTCSYGNECCCGRCHPSFKSQCIDGRWSGYYTDACMRPDCPNPGGCSCNGHLHLNRGECGIQADCGRWCYVDEHNSCPDAKPSSWGAAYAWSCQACRNRGGLPSPPDQPDPSGHTYKGCVTEGAYINSGRNTPQGRALRSEGAADCARKCRGDRDCKAWSMRLNNNLCWLKTTSEGTTPNEDWIWGLPCYQGEEPECPMTDGAYINGGRNTEGGVSRSSRGQQDCARQCFEDLTCEAWTMRKDNNLCWLKTTSEGTTPSQNWVWGLPCSPGGGCVVTEEAYINGGRNTAGGRALRSEGRRDCARQCRDDSNCKAWTMRVDNNLCWLKTTREGTTRNQNWVWGLPC